MTQRDRNLEATRQPGVGGIRPEPIEHRDRFQSVIGTWTEERLGQPSGTVTVTDVRERLPRLGGLRYAAQPEQSSDPDMPHKKSEGSVARLGRFYRPLFAFRFSPSSELGGRIAPHLRHLDEGEFFGRLAIADRFIKQSRDSERE